DALEALGNAFMVKAVELDIKLQKLANEPLPPHVRDAMDSCILTAPIQLFEQGTTSEFLEVGDLSCREIKPGKPREPPAHAAARKDRGSGRLSRNRRSQRRPATPL